MLPHDALRCNPPPVELPTARPKGATLAQHHVEYLEARAVGDRGMFWTADRPSKIPPMFSEYQRKRGSALIAEFVSPSGAVSWQARFDTPRRDRSGKVQKWVSPPADRAPVVLGLVPAMLDEVRNGTGPLWSVEGLTRAAALATFGIPAVAWAGCWNWQKDGEPLPCWNHVNLDGRLVFVGMDGDWRTNELVQRALEAHVAFLESRGARVLVVSVPEVPGVEKPGIDDAIAAGVSPYALQLNAKPYQRVDVGRERLRKDERLRLFVAAKLREVRELPAVKQSECSRRKVARFLVSVVPRHGKLSSDGRGVVVHPSFPQIAEATRLGSFQTVRKALDGLAELGFLERLGRRSPKEATSYLLLDPWGRGSAHGVNIGTGEDGEGEGQESKGTYEEDKRTSLYKRDSSLCLHSTHIPENARKADMADVPPLRYPKLVHTYARREGHRVVVHSDYFWRYGPKREEILRYILERGGADAGELHEKFGSKTSRIGRFVETWLYPMLGDGVLYETDGGLIVPAPDWLEALERVKARTGEDQDNRLQSRRYAQQRREYRAYLERVRKGENTKADRTPKLGGKGRTREALERNRTIWRRQRVERERERVGTTASVFIADTLEGISGLRWAEMRQLWRARGGSVEDLQRAVNDPTTPFRFVREADDELYVYATGSRGEQEPVQEAPTTPLLRPDFSKPELRDGIYHHGPECSCEWCDEPMPQRYATPAVGIMP